MINKRTVAIVGAGFCGTMTAANIVRNCTTRSQIKIIIFEKEKIVAQGLAYSTRDPYHFLNVQAERMGAFPEAPEHFYQWVLANRNKWEGLFPDLNVRPESFLPRHLYFLYLDDLWKCMQKEAYEKSIEIQLVQNEVVDIVPEANHLNVVIKNGDTFLADAVVLATSLPQNQQFHLKDLKECERWIESFWNGELSKVPKDENQLVAIIGTGLTMVDAVISLVKNGYRGKIAAISNAGMPEKHLVKYSRVNIDVRPEKSIRKLFHQIRSIFKQQALESHPWQLLLDSLRPRTVALWEALPLTEQKRFMRHLWGRWNKWRHRIAPSSFDIIDPVLRSGQLKLIKGKVKAVLEGKIKPLALDIGAVVVEADFVINCSGSRKELYKSDMALYDNLLRKGIIKSHPLHMGLVVDENYQVVGKNFPIYALGQLLLGQKFETIAIPELRQQCSAVAASIACYGG